MEEDLNLNDQNITIPTTTYLELRKKAKDLDTLEKEFDKLKNDYQILKVDSSVAVKGTEAEAKSLALVMVEANNFFNFAGLSLIDFEDPNIVDMRSFVANALQKARDELGLDVWFSENEDLLVVIKNLKQALMLKNSLVKETKSNEITILKA